MLPPYVHSATFILAITALVGCLGRFDYNIVLALGWMYLADIHDSLTSIPSFTIMVVGSIIIDIITILISTSQWDKFTFVFMPLFEVFIKIVIIGFTVYYQLAKKKADQQRSNQLSQL